MECIGVNSLDGQAVGTLVMACCRPHTVRNTTTETVLWVISSALKIPIGVGLLNKYYFNLIVNPLFDVK